MKIQNRYWLIILSIVFTAALVTACGKPKVSKEEWKAKLSQNNGVFRQTGTTIVMKKVDFVKVMGDPDKTQTVDNSTFWYYNCGDGTIQLVLNTGNLNAAGIMQGTVNDY